jgi:hypothetical protein
MITSYNTDFFYPIDLLYQLSKNAGKPVMHLKVDGKRSDEIWEFYWNKADNTVVSSLRDKGEVYCYFQTIQQATDAFNEWFPQEEHLGEDEKDYYVSVELVDVASGAHFVNGSQV